MTDTEHVGKWQVEARQGSMQLKTSRIGVFEVNAHAPITGGSADWEADSATLTFGVAIGEVKTGNALLDPEVHALVHKGSDGILTFAGSGRVSSDEVHFEGTATAGNVRVPLELTGDVAGDSPRSRDLRISGTATFTDIHIPLPGFSHLDHVDVRIEGDLRLTR